MIECLCRYGRINEYKKLFLKAWDVPEGESFEPIESDCDIMDDFVTGKCSSIDTTLLLLQQRLFIMSPKTEKTLCEGLELLRDTFSGVSEEDRRVIQKKKRRKRQCH
jgi:hypothetical protein